MAPWGQAGRVAWRLVAFAVAFVLLQGIAEAVLGPVGRWLTRQLGSPIPLYPWTTLAGALGASALRTSKARTMPFLALARPSLADIAAMTTSPSTAGGEVEVPKLPSP